MRTKKMKEAQPCASPNLTAGTSRVEILLCINLAYIPTAAEEVRGFLGCLLNLSPDDFAVEHFVIFFFFVLP